MRHTALLPGVYDFRSQGHQHLVRLDAPHTLSQLLIDLDCGSLLCTVVDAGSVAVVNVRHETVITETLPQRSNKEFMQVIGCGSVFLCSTDGTRVTILKAKT